MNLVIVNYCLCQNKSFKFLYLFKFISVVVRATPLKCILRSASYRFGVENIHQYLVGKISISISIEKWENIWGFSEIFYIFLGDFFLGNICILTEKSFLNLIKSNRNQIVLTIFRLICNQISSDKTQWRQKYFIGCPRGSCLSTEWGPNWGSCMGVLNIGGVIENNFFF